MYVYMYIVLFHIYLIHVYVHTDMYMEKVESRGEGAGKTISRVAVSTGVKRDGDRGVSRWRGKSLIHGNFSSFSEARQEPGSREKCN